MKRLAYGLSLLLARSAWAQVPLQSDTPVVDQTPVTEAPAPQVVSPNAPSGTTLPEPPKPRVVTTPPPHIDSTSRALTTPPPLERRRPNVGVLSGGLTMLVAGYVADIGFTYGYDHHPQSTSLIPIAGPWLQLRQHYGLDGPPIDTGSSDADARASKTVDNANSTIRGLAIAGEVASGIVQAAGVVMAIVGAISKGKPRPYATHRPDARTPSPVSPLARIQPNGSLLLRF